MVEELSGTESIFDIVVIEVRLCGPDVIAEVGSIAHAFNKVGSDKFTDIGIGLSTKGDLDGLWC